MNGQVGVKANEHVPNILNKQISLCEFSVASNIIMNRSTEQQATISQLRGVIGYRCRHGRHCPFTRRHCPPPVTASAQGREPTMRHPKVMTLVRVLQPKQHIAHSVTGCTVPDNQYCLRPSPKRSEISLSRLLEKQGDQTKNDQKK